MKLTMMITMMNTLVVITINPVALGVTGPDGTYDIGSIDIFAEDSVQLFASNSPGGTDILFDNSRLFPLVESADGQCSE